MPHPDFSHQDGISFVADDAVHDFVEPVSNVSVKRKGKGKDGESASKARVAVSPSPCLSSCAPAGSDPAMALPYICDHTRR